MSRDDRRDYEVGYGKPPRWSRFGKGESGNPAGRPRKSNPGPAPISPVLGATEEVLRRELAQIVPITVNGQTKAHTALEVIQKAQVKTALKGSPTAAYHLLQASRELDEKEAERCRQELADKQQRYDDFCIWKDQQERAWSAAAKRGEEPDEPWPHPEDFLLHPDTLSCRVRGPVDEETVPLFRYYEAERDLCLLRAAVEISRAGRGCSGLQRGWTVLWVLHDQRLPRRWQLPGNGGPLLEMVYWPTHKLLAELALAEDRAVSLRPPSFNVPRDKETYDIVNRCMKPLLRQLGYRSLAHFERDFAARDKRPATAR